MGKARRSSKSVDGEMGGNMKRIIGLIFILCSTNLFGQSWDNKLKKIDVSSGDHTSQVVFEFAYPFYYEKVESRPNEQVKLYFPKMNVADFKKLDVESRIRQEKHVKSVKLSSESFPIPRVVLTITFNKDAVILLLVKQDDFNRLIFDIFDRESLRMIEKQSTTIRQTSNDYSRGSRLELTSFFSSYKFKKKKSIEAILT